MPSLAFALDPATVESEFCRFRPRLTGKNGALRLRAIRVTRYKPARRCMVEYDLEIEQPGLSPEVATLIGKVRVGRSGKSGYRLLKALWNAGFQSNSADGISVPQPIGKVSKFRMWLQRKVPGLIATDLLATPRGKQLARRIAEAAAKIHQARVPTEARHTMDDELRILRERLPEVAQVEPRFTCRIERLLEACHRLGARTPERLLCGIHRDFYSDQVIVDGRRIYIVDFDLYCEGDQGLDIGNFLGHLVEQSQLVLGDPHALADRQQAMEDRFVELAGEKSRVAVQAYTTLTLVRHIYLSTQFPGRRAFTETLLALCEDRLGIARPKRVVEAADRGRTESTEHGSISR